METINAFTKQSPPLESVDSAVALLSRPSTSSLVVALDEVDTLNEELNGGLSSSRDLEDPSTAKHSEDEEDADGEGASLSISKELIEREKHYRRLNKQLQSKTQQVVKRAEEVMKESKQTLETPSDSIRDNEVINTHLAKTDDAVKWPSTAPTRSRRLSNPVPPSSSEFRPSTSATQQHHPLRSTSRGGVRPGEGVVGKIPASRSRPLTSSNIHQEALKNVQFLPPNVSEAEIGSEATIRLLKAKLVVVQEEMERVVSEGSNKGITVVKMEEKLKMIDDERAKLAKTVTALQAQVEKLKQQNDDLKKRNEASETECAALKKELELRQRERRQGETDANAKELRLNRALDEAEKYKSMVAKNNAEAKEKMDHMKSNLEKLYAENKRLIKQKADFITVFKKQNQLIDVVKRQKMHLESATMLKISEEEFVRALSSKPGGPGARIVPSAAEGK
ncbi:Golgin sub A member 2 [Phlyctochytrium planicorne]|nr:Golgin sub A member 2 [Phlyctochytrium planicorne]